MPGLQATTTTTQEHAPRDCVRPSPRPWDVTAGGRGQRETARRWRYAVSSDRGNTEEARLSLGGIMPPHHPPCPPPSTAAAPQTRRSPASLRAPVSASRPGASSARPKLTSQKGEARVVELPDGSSLCVLCAPCPPLSAALLRPRLQRARVAPSCCLPRAVRWRVGALGWTPPLSERRLPQAARTSNPAKEVGVERGLCGSLPSLLNELRGVMLRLSTMYPGRTWAGAPWGLDIV